MRGFLASAIVVLALFAGCGDDDATTSTSGSTPTAPSHDPGAGAVGGPTGELAADGIGPVAIGSGEDAVAEVFGEPIMKEDVDFGAGGGEAPQTNWVYRFSDGDVTLKFETATEGLAAYDVYTTELETADGVRVGDPQTKIEKLYGDDLVGSPLGVNSLVLSDDPGTTKSPALTFALDGKNIVAISGGAVVQPAGE